MDLATNQANFDMDSIRAKDSWLEIIKEAEPEELAEAIALTISSLSTSLRNIRRI